MLGWLVLELRVMSMVGLGGEAIGGVLVGEVGLLLACWLAGLAMVWVGLGWVFGSIGNRVRACARVCLYVCLWIVYDCGEDDVCWR